MAINPNTQYPGQVETPDANYPYGGAKNETTPSTPTVPGSLDGTPLEKAMLNDIFGFQQALLTEAAIVPSGNAETALASQYLDALKILFARLGVVNNWTAQQYFATQTITSSLGVLDWDLNTEQVAVTTLTEDTTLNAPTNQQNGGQYRLLVIQNGTGGWALNFNGVYVPAVSGGSLPTIATGVSEYTLLNFDSDGTNMRVA